MMIKLNKKNGINLLPIQTFSSQALWTVMVMY